MKLIWLHGAPAVGKLTIAKQLKQVYGFKLFHNHLAVDLSLSIYDEFGDKDFFDFTNEIRRTVLRKAKMLGVTHLVMTYMTCSENDKVEINRYLAFFESQGIEIYPIHLCPDHQVILERSVSHERLSTHKLSCQKTMIKQLKENKFLAIKHDNTLSIDNTNISPEEIANTIAAFVD